MVIARCLALGILLAGCEDQKSGGDLSMPMDMAVAVDLTQIDLESPPDLRPSCVDDAGMPATLACTGLYFDFATKTVSAEVQAYAPGYELWSDDAKKSRYILLPPGGQIDVTTMDDWIFPVGTKVWKEFRLTIGGTEKRVETRLLWKRGDADWVGLVYRWNDAETEANHLRNGEGNVGGTMYEIPAENRCISCHIGRTDRLAGFEAVLLAAPTATGLTWDQLKSQSLVTASNGHATIATSALQIPGNAIEVAALGFLHTNCGILCHQPGLGTPFSLNIDVSSGAAPTMVSGTSAFITAVGITSDYKPASAGVSDNYYRIRPTDVTRSTIHIRMSSRDAPVGSSGIDQMPPLITHVVPADGLAAVDAWINSMTAAPYPAPGPL
jgi:hypothetical protein